MAQPAKNDAREYPPSGFRAHISGATLADLVQFECLARTDAVFRITSRHEVGYLFFRAGQVVHAISRDATGLSAAREILRWSEGAFEPCRVPWPEAETIKTSWQNLLLSVAQMQDESGQRFMAVDKEPPVSVALRSTVPVPAPPHPAPPVYHGVVRLDPSGKTVDARGARTEELAERAAYAVRVAQLVGQALGMDGLTAFETIAGNDRYLIQVDASESIVALRAAPGTDLAALRERAGV